MQKTYPTYKPTSIPWLTEIPEHWDLIGLNLIFKDNKVKNKGMVETNVLSLSYGNIIRKQKTENYGLIPESFETYQIIEPGHIILRLTDLQNDKKSFRVGYVRERGIITSAYTGLIPEKVSSKYYYYILHYADIKKHFYSLGGGVRQSSDYNEIKKEKVPLPPFEEQAAIANYLDAKTEQINRFIEKKERLIALLKEQKKAFINEILNEGEDIYPTIRVKFVGKVNPTKSSSTLKIDDSDNVVFLPMEKVSENGKIDCSILKPTLELKNGFTFFEKGDIIIAKITPCFENGKGALLSNLLTPYGFGSTEFHTVRAYTKKVNPEYLWWILHSEAFLSLGEYFMEGSAGQKRVPVEFVKNYLAVIPSIQKQNEVLCRIKFETDRIDTTIQRIQTEIQKVKELKQSLIAEVVTGKIKVV
ncbi:restriction endonuclease subunit S [Chitinophaga sp. 22536]|uniref:restriction endonuclease subunit S n=1 Tax=unclassified Chitinophaga TaxID=2619133 RepID=UPI003F86FBB6